MTSLKSNQAPKNTLPKPKILVNGGSVRSATALGVRTNGYEIKNYPSSTYESQKKQKKQDQKTDYSSTITGRMMGRMRPLHK